MKPLLLLTVIALAACSSPFHKLAKQTEIGSEAGYVSVSNPAANIKSLTFGDFEFATSSHEYRSLTGTKPPFRGILLYALTREPEYEYFILLNPRFAVINEEKYSLREIQIGENIVSVAVSLHAPVNDITFIKYNVKPSDIVFATYTYSTNNRLQNLEPLAEHLSSTTGLPIRAVSYPTVQALIEAVRTGEADFAMMNTSGYLVLQRNHSDAATTLVNLSLGSESVTNYGGCLIARRELGISSMSDVAAIDNRIPLALVASTSTSGNLVPRLLLNSNGIPDPESKFDVTYSGTHAKVVEDVLSGKAMLGGTGCAEIDKARQNSGFDTHAVVVGSFDDIPLGPVVHSSKMGATTASRIAELLKTLHDDNPSVFTNFLQGWSEFLQAKRFVPVTDSDYDPFRRMFGTNEALWKLIE